MSESILYQAHVRLERVQGHVRRAHLPAETQPILFGVHDELAAYFHADVTEQDVHADPLDYLVAATGSSLIGTLGSALEARKIPAGEGKLSATVVGDVVLKDKVLVLDRIHVTYHLKLERDQRATARRVHSFHMRYCPLARTLEESVEITTTLETENL